MAGRDPDGAPGGAAGAGLDGPLALAHTALALALARPALGGLVLVARPSPLREALLGLASFTRLHPGMDDAALFGGTDALASLSEGRIVTRAGLLSGPGPFLLAGADRLDAARAARIAAAARGRTLVALDEGPSEGDEGPAGALAVALSGALALRGDLTGLAMRTDLPPLPALGADAALPDGTDAAIAALTLSLGIADARAWSFAATAARALGALHGRSAAHAEDVEIACALTLAHRATRAPAPEEPLEEEEAPPNEAEADGQGGEDDALPPELLLEAVRAHLPPDLLAGLTRGPARATGAGSGARRKGGARGRPLPSRPGRPGQGRVDVLATLRAAAPWQRLRGAEPGRIAIRPADIRIRRAEARADRLLIFTVDASGSQAVARLAEAKGAIELLLADAYARRDHVALVAFRGEDAQELLPPTRSLVQAKRRLAGLPGGGATPLASGLALAAQVAERAARAGQTPVICLLTDGRGNVALDGTRDRKAAARDAARLATALRHAGREVLVIDTGARPDRALATLSGLLDARHVALPRADARRLADGVAEALS
ncbi:MAG: VWA domain-containing protein [Paracoccaceae bacterium]